MIQVGCVLEFKSGLKYEVIKVHSHDIVDLRAMQPQFEWMPDFLPVFYSVKIKEYKILNEETLAKQSYCEYDGGDGCTKNVILPKCFKCRHYLQ